MTSFEQEVVEAHKAARINGTCSLDEICSRLNRPNKHSCRLAVYQSLMRMRERGLADYFRSNDGVDQWCVQLWYITEEKP